MVGEVYGCILSGYALGSGCSSCLDFTVMANPVFSSTVLGLIMALIAPTTPVTAPSFAFEENGEQESGFLDTLSKPPSYFPEQPSSDELEEEHLWELVEDGTTHVPTPTGLLATADGNSVILTWNYISTNAINSDITGFEYHQKVLSESYGEWEPMNDSNGNSTSYMVMDLDYGRTYEFQIRAVSDNMKGTPSTAVSVTIPEQPAAPTDFTVFKAPAHNRYHYQPSLLQWELVDSNSNISGYELRILEGTKVFKDWKLLTLNPAITTFNPGMGGARLLADPDYSTNSGYLLLPKQDYTFQLRAITPTIKGQISEVIVNYPYDNPYSADLVSAKIVDGDVKLSWSDYTNRVAPYKYEYRMKEQGGSFGSWIMIEDSFPDGTTPWAHDFIVLTHSTIIEDLEPGTNYTFEVRASLGDLFHVGYPWSPSTSIRTPGPAAPADLEVYVSPTPDNYYSWPDVMWTLVDSDSDISGYELRVLEGTKVFKDWQALTIRSSAPAGMGATGLLSDYLLLPSQDYTFQLRAITPTIKGRISEVNVNPPSRQPFSPSPVTVAIVDGDVKLSWSDRTNGIAPYKYEYRMKEQGESFGSWIKIADSFKDGTAPYGDDVTILTHSTMIEDLEPGTNYTFEVRASLGDLFHMSYPHTNTSVNITTPSQPAAPADLEVIVDAAPDNYHSLPDVRWTLLDSNSDISGYELRVLEGTKVFKNWQALTIRSSAPAGMGATGQLNDYLLLPNQDYTFQLRAITPIIKGLVSEVNVNPPSRQPFSPNPVTATIVDGDVKLSWSDRTNGIAPYKYEYRMKGQGESFGSWIKIADSFKDGTASYGDDATILTHSTMISNLYSNTTYTFEVRASLGDLFHIGYPSWPASVTIETPVPVAVPNPIYQPVQ